MYMTAWSLLTRQLKSLRSIVTMILGIFSKRRVLIVGFGVNSPEKSRAIAEVADGVVVGSAIVGKIGAGDSVADVLAFVKTLADGTHSA